MKMPGILIGLMPGKGKPGGGMPPDKGMDNEEEEKGEGLQELQSLVTGFLNAPDPESQAQAFKEAVLTILDSR